MGFSARECESRIVGERLLGERLLGDRIVRVQRPQDISGFSLIEIMIVVVILGILTGLVAQVVGGKDDKARVQAARTDLKTLSNALDMYKLDNYNYPSTEQGLEALVKNPGNAPNWNAHGYVKSMPKDPWGRDYVYLSPGTSGDYDLLCLGRDGAEGGEGYDADIVEQ
ncbi:MAG: type II secretion system major pseudopilin GspG [Gammaproteobacteria bacterium]